MRPRAGFQPLLGLIAAAALSTGPLVAADTATSSFSVPDPSTSIWHDFEARDLDGRVWAASELEGRVVLLDFWATWCAPCLAEIPTLQQATERFGENGFLVLGISLNGGERRPLESFLRRQGIHWPQVHDGRGFEGPLARRFEVEILPRTLLVDRSGRIVGVDLRGEVLLAVLPPLLAADRSAPAARAGDRSGR